MLKVTGKNRTIYLFVTLCYFGAYLLLLSADLVTVGNSGIERALWDLAHIPLYGGLAVLVYIHLGNRNRHAVSFFQATWRTLIITLFIALLDEWSQVLIAARRASVQDLVLDVIGIFVALWIIYKITNQRLHKEIREGQEG